MQPMMARCIAGGAMLLIVTTPVACSAPHAGKVGPATAVNRLPPVGSTGDVVLAGHFPNSNSTASQNDALQTSDSQQPFVTPDRLARGYTIVVVGVNGDNSLSSGLAPGLVEGGYSGAVEVVDWTTGFWPLFIYHLRAGNRHRAGARLIAGKIADYQARYPRGEVNLVGYSAGAVVAVEAVKALDEGRQIDRLVLLAGAISPLYDLRSVLGRSRKGVWNYYQPQDVVALWAGTVLAGTADGQHIMSAGAVGFWRRPGQSDQERQLYRDKLVQLPYQPKMALSGNLGGHFQCTGRRFVAEWISPLLSPDSSPGVGSRPVKTLR